MDKNSYEEDAQFGYEEAQDDAVACFGDPRRCPMHPRIKISSDDGMFDGDCCECEAEADEAYERGVSISVVREEREIRAAAERQPPMETLHGLETDAMFDDEIPF